MMTSDELRLTGSVQISQISDNVNPQPVKIDDAAIFDDFLSPRRLRALTGVEDLSKVTELEMQVDTGEASLGNFGNYLPNLRLLKLNNSIIPSVRDLGSSLFSLHVLWMPQCCLENLDGIATMSTLQELYLSYNELKDVSPCGMLENLEILDLEGNFIDDLHNVMYLSMCIKLRKLTLEGNPVCVRPSVDDTSSGYNYREELIKIMPQLEYLDDVSVTIGGAGVISDSTSTSVADFDEHWSYINNLLQESGLVAAASNESLDTSGLGSTLPSSGRPITSSVPPRPQSGLRMPKEQKRLMTPRGCPGTANRPRSAVVRPASSTSNNSLDDLVDLPEDSNLTAGHVVCGNISKALRKRPTVDSPEPLTSPLRPRTSAATDRGGIQSADDHRLKFPIRPNPVHHHQTSSRIGFSNPPSANPRTSSGHSQKDSFIMEDFDKEHSVVVEELKEWKSKYENSLSRVKQARAPQILRVNHDDSVDILSDDDDDDDMSETSVNRKSSLQYPPLSSSTNSTVRKLPELRVQTAGPLGNRLRRQLSTGNPLLPSKPVLRH